jgi:hypothetical protein
MKFVLAFTNRTGGSGEDAEEAQERAMQLLAKFQPSQSATIHQWVTRCDGGGGFSVVETDNAEDLLHDLSIWSPYIDFQVYPVVDVMEASAVQRKAIEFRKSVD